jgi:hypothetical protein
MSRKDKRDKKTGAALAALIIIAAVVAVLVAVVFFDLRVGFGDSDPHEFYEQIVKFS